MMIRKSTDKLTVGDIVAQPVTDGKGGILIQDGTELTATLIRVLERRGVTEVAIRSGEVEETADEKATRIMYASNSADTNDIARAKIKDMRERLLETFKPVMNNGRMMKLFEAVNDYQTQQISTAFGG